MATNKYIRGLSRAGFRVNPATGNPVKISSSGNTQVDLDDIPTQLTLAGERDNFVRVSGSGATTTTIVGLDRAGFRILNNGGSVVTCKIGSGVHTVSLTDYTVLRSLRRNVGRFVYSTSATALTIRGIQAEQNGFDTNDTLAGGSDTTTITTDVTGAANADTVVINATTYTFVTALTEAKATDTVTTSGTPASTRAIGTVTTSGTGAANNDTVSIGGVTYTFKTALTGAANEVLRTGTEDVDLTNLIAAVNATSGSGTTYGTGTVIDPLVTAGTVTSHVLTLTAKSYLAANGNAVALAKTGSVLTVSGALFTTGVNETVNVNGHTYTFVEALDAATPDEVLINGQDVSLTNLAAAINGTSGAGTTYGTGTVVNADVTSGVVTSHAITLTAKVLGTAPNSDTLAVVGSHLSRGTATFAGGLASVADQVVVGGSVNASLASLGEAINGGANAGVDYSSATTASTDVSASAAGAVLTLTKLETATEEIAVSTTSAHLTVAAAVLDNPLSLIYRLKSATVNPQDWVIFRQLRRYHKKYIEAG